MKKKISPQKENFHRRTSRQEVGVEEENKIISDRVRNPPLSPVISKSHQHGKKLKVSRSKGRGVKNSLSVPQKDNQNMLKNELKTCELEYDDDNVMSRGAKRVGKVPPSIQSELDKVTHQGRL